MEARVRLERSGRDAAGSRPRRGRRAVHVVAAIGAAIALAVAGTGSAGATQDHGVTPGPISPSAGPGTGLHAASTGACRGGYAVSVPGSAITPCTHGPDEPPPGIDVDASRSTDTLQQDTFTTSAVSPVPVVGDGTSGPRIQAVYVVASDRADRYAAVAPLITQWAAAANDVYVRSARKTNGALTVRWVTKPDRTLDVAHVVVAPSADDTFGNTIAALQAQGYARADRKYLVWVDANVYCGIGTVWNDDRASASNLNNTGPSWARVDTGCWGLPGQSVEAHELTHNLGAVQPSAPHATTGYHCTDDADRMCYQDGPGVIVTQVCPPLYENFLDCNNDDYFSTAPPPGSYLAGHWNVASSSFLQDLVDVQAPTSVAVMPRHKSVRVSWDHPGGPGLVGFTVTATPGRWVTTDASTRTTIVPGLTNGVAVSVTVTARYADGRRAESDPPIVATPRQAAPSTGGFVADGWGALHRFTLRNGSAPASANTPYWLGWDIVRGVALLPDDDGGYMLDAYGGVHPFGVDGNPAPPPVTRGPYWLGQDVARGIALLDDGTGGYILTANGAVERFAIAGSPLPPAVTNTPTLPGIARGIALLPDNAGGYILDGWGGLHPIGVGASGPPPPATRGPSWLGWDIARGITMASGGNGGLVLDAYGGLQPFAVGSATKPPPTSSGPYWLGWGIARGASF